MTHLVPCYTTICLLYQIHTATLPVTGVNSAVATVDGTRVVVVVTGRNADGRASDRDGGDATPGGLPTIIAAAQDDCCCEDRIVNGGVGGLITAGKDVCRITVEGCVDEEGLYWRGCIGGLDNGFLVKLPVGGGGDKVLRDDLGDLLQ